MKLILILDNIRSRENVGSIFRTADAVGVCEIYFCGITPRPPHPKISKSSLGADLFVHHSYVRDSWRLVTKLKNQGVKVVALEQTDDARSVFEYKPGPAAKGLALVVGNEVAGVSAGVLKRVQLRLSIPMYGRKESLNVAVATGVALYAIRRRLAQDYV